MQVNAGDAILEGDLEIPPQARAVILFAHGSGSSRFSSRNRYVAEVLRARGLGTLLIDLLTLEEEAIDLKTRHLRFDIDLLSRRLVGAAKWLGSQRETASLPVGLFGASTGAAAALVCAAEIPEKMFAVVSRGGRPDLAGPALPKVKAPTLLIVGGDDAPVIVLNQEAAAKLSCEHRIEIIPGASHLFEERGTLEKAAALARDWFLTHPGNLQPATRNTPP